MGDRKAARQGGPGQRHRYQIAGHKVGCTADNLAWFIFADVDFAGADRLFEFGELFDLGHPSDGQRSVDGAERDHLFDFVPDAHERLLEVVWRHVPAGCAYVDHLAQPAVRDAHQAPTPNGNENRTSPSTISRMSGMPLRNCRVRSSPIPNAKPE